MNGESSYAAARDRAEGVAQAMEQARIPLVGGKALFGQWGEGWGRDCARLLASAHSDLDGIVAGSDHIARGVIDALREEGRRVPDDVSVVGFDNWDILVRESRPPLTSVDMNVAELGCFTDHRSACGAGAVGGGGVLGE